MVRIVGLWVLALLVVFVSAVSARPAGAAQPGAAWSVAERIPDYGDNSAAPYLVADRYGTVHAVNSQIAGSKVAVVYRRWTLADGWTPPTDILLPPVGGDANVQGLYLDGEGVLHVVFHAGTQAQAGIYYSKAPVSSANSAPVWTAPVLVGKDASHLAYAILAGDEGGALIVAYSGVGAGNGLYAVVSLDSGKTWSEPSVVFLTRDLRRDVSEIRGCVDSRGQLHVVWSVSNQAGNSEAVYYSRLTADRRVWSNPVVVGENTGYEADMAAIVEHGNELFVMYHTADDLAVTRWMKRSGDGGKTWSPRVLPFAQFRGTYGHPVFVHDSSGTLHVVLGNRLPAAQGAAKPDTHGMWHAVWQKDRWSGLEPIISGPQVKQGELFDPTDPQAVVVQGNVMLVTWRTDPGLGGNGAWYSYTTLNAPALPLLASPTPAPTPTIALAATALPRPTSQTAHASLPAPSPERQTPSIAEPMPSQDPTGWLIFGIAPAVVLVSVVVAGRLISGRRR